MNYLQLCQSLRRECGIQGTGPTSVTGQIGLLEKLVGWIADANDEICGFHHDWNFLWSQFEEPTIANTSTVTRPSDIGLWDTDSFCLDYNTDDYRKLKEMSYRQWRKFFRNGTRTPDKPSFFAVRPDKNIVLEPIPDDVYTLTADYWKIAPRLTNNPDEPLIPENLQRIIVVRAKIYYAEHDNAPEVMQGAMQEFQVLINSLRGSELPGYAENKTGSAPENFVVVTE